MKKILFLIILLFVSTKKIYANELTVMKLDIATITEQPLPTEVVGYYPRIVYSQNKNFENDMNIKIVDYCNEIINQASTSKYIKKVVIDFKETRNISKYTKSIIIESSVTSSTTKRQVKAFTIDTKNAKLLSITDDLCLGPSGLEIASSIINKQILNNTDKYNITFTKITDDNNFYIDNNNLHVVYANHNFILKIDSIVMYTLNKNSYVSLKNQVPLREVSEKFGFIVKWNEKDKKIEVIKDDFIASIEIDKNTYIINNTNKILDFPPILKDSLTYVPISFFDQVLDIKYSITSNYDIIFSYYKTPV